MFAVPTETAVTRPVPSTVATAVLSEAHVTVLLLAVSGVTVAVNWSVSPTVSVDAFSLRVTPVTAITGVTVMTAVSV